MLNWLMQGFTLKEAFELYKFKLKLFNTRTYNVLKLIYLWLVIQKAKLANLKNKYSNN